MAFNQDNFAQLKTCLASLESIKLTERKKGAEELTELLKNSNCVQLIHEQPDGGITWDSIFKTCHSAILREIDKNIELVRQGKAVATSRALIFQSLITDIPRLANRGTSRLSCTELVSPFLVIYNYKPRTYLNDYTNIILESVLSQPRYWSEIDVDTWNALLKAFKKIYGDPAVKKVQVLKAIERIVKHGCKHSQFLLILKKDIFTFLEEVVENEEYNKAYLAATDLQLAYLELCLTVCLLLGYEIRATLCKFGETILPALLQIYEAKNQANSLKKSVLFKLLLLLVTCHHPGGATHSPGAYAYNLDEWHKQLLKLWNTVDLEVMNIQRNAFFYKSKSFVHREPFISLAVELAKQILEMNSSVMDVTVNPSLDDTVFTQAGPSPKRRRIEVGLAAIMTKLRTMNNSLDMGPWLVILGELISKYPTVIKNNEFVPLMRLMSDLLSTCNKESPVMDDLYRCCSSILLAQKFIKLDVVDSNDAKEQINAIWETALRTVGLNLSEAGSHHLLRSLLSSHFNSEKADSLLKMYLSGTINLSSDTVLTLEKLVSLLTSFENSDREALLKSLISQFAQYQSRFLIKPDLFAKVFIKLIARVELPQPSSDQWSECFTIESGYLITTFQSGLFTGSCEKLIRDSIKLETKKVDCRLSQLLSNAVREIRYSALESSQLDLKSYISFLIDKTTLHHSLSHYESLFEGRILENIPDLLESTLLELNKRIVSYLETADTKKNTITELNNVIRLYEKFRWKKLKVSNTLFDDDSSDGLVKVVIKFLRPKTITNRDVDDFFGLNSNDQPNEEVPVEPASLLSAGLLQEDEHLKLLAIKLVLLFICSTEKIVCQRQAELITDLLTIVEKMDPTKTVDLQISILVLESVDRIPGLSETQIDSIIEIIKNVCSPWKRNQEVIRRVLSMLGDFSKTIFASRDEEFKETFVRLVKGCDLFIQKNIFGPSINAELITCIAKTLKVSPEYCWRAKVCLDDCDVPLPIRILSYLKSPYHQSRLSAVKYVASVFDSAQSKNDTDLAFSTLTSVIEIIYVAPDSLSKEQLLDEGANRTATLLHGLASVICCSETLRRKALLLLLQVTVQKKINVTLVESVLKLICKFLETTVEAFLSDHFYFLIWNWYAEFKSVDNFLFKFLNCNSLQQMYSKFQTDIVCVFFLRNNENALTAVADTLGKTVPKLLEESFSKLMAILLPLVTEKDLIEGTIKSGEILMKLKANFSVDSHHFQSLMSASIPDIILNFIRILGHESTVLPPIFKFSTVADFFNYLQESSDSPSLPLVCYMCRESPQDIQKLLLALTSDIHKTSTKELRILALKRFQVICEILGQSSKEIESMAHYVLKYIICTLSHFIREPDENFRFISLSCLDKFIISTLPHSAQIISTILPLLTSTLTPLVHGASRTAEKSLRLLEYLIVNFSKNLEDGISLLDPFPAREQFNKINQKYLEICYRNSPMRNLENEIKHFLQAGSICKVDASARIQGLRHLHSILASKKEELAALYADLDHIRGFSEDCAQSILHRLICMLVQLASSSDMNVNLEAAKCLGELGAADLKTLILFPEDSKSGQINSPAETLFFAKSLQLLINNLTDKNIHLVSVTSKALYLIFDLHIDSVFIRDKLTSAEKEFIHPFIHAGSSKGKKKQFDILSIFNIELFESNFAAFEASLTVRDDLIFESWLTCLISSILDALTDKNCFLFSLKPICLAKPAVGEELLPYICYLLLSNNVDVFTSSFNRYLNEFFKSLFIAINEKRYSNFIYLNHKAVELLLSVIQFIRLRQKRPDVDVLKLNYLHIALAAQYCSAHFSSIFYAELWWNHLKMEQNWITPSGQSLTSIEYICEHSQEEGIILQNILRQAYTNLGDMDAVKGCGSYHLLKPDSRVEYYQQTGQWQKVLEANDLKLSNSLNISINTDIVNALKNCGIYNLAGHLVRDGKSESLSDSLYEISWRLSNWSVSIDAEKGSYESWHYAALKSLQNADVEGVKLNLKEARLSVLQSLSSASLQSSKNIYPFLSKLHCLQEIDDVCEVLTPDHSENLDFAHKWKAQTGLNGQKMIEFEYLEPLLSQRAVILQMLKSNLFPQLCLDIIKTSRAEGCYHVANRHLKLVSEHPSLTKDLKKELSLEEAQLFWAESDIHVARILMRALLKELEDLKKMTSFKSNVLRIYGGWMADTNSESAQDIVDKYLAPATNLPGSDSEITATRLAAYDRLARYADFQYQNIQRYIKSDVFQNKEAGVEWQDEVVDRFKKTGTNTVDVSRAVLFHSRQSKNDNMEVQNTYKDKDRNLILAMKCYLRSLAGGNCEDMRVFRVVGMWLENTTNSELMEFLEKALHHIPTYKFIPVLPQLIARLTKKLDTDFAKTLFNLIGKCAVEHPHHTLPLVFALANSYKDRKLEPSPAPRVLGAQALISKLRERATLSSLLKDMEKVCDAYIALANLPPEARGKGSTIPRTEAIAKLKNITTVLCPTITLPINKRGDYSNVVGIQSIENSYSTPGGVNAPKKITCVGTDGLKYVQLVKGQDDLRQDAVMQQVFSILNKLLHQDKNTAKRKLLIRTYKIVPMSQRSGVLEWCMNTQPLSMYLIGANQRSGAHAKYRPNDKSSPECRSAINEAQKRKASNEEKLQIFNQICKEIQPVFRYFFLEYFPSPGIWFERRTAYIHSVASSSMVGYILGLGDRHVVNILIDNSTAEVIHIDFGIAFEQGMTLPCPETVPFRLTRDIEDGMGVSGIEGVFKTCCEKTMSVLRANQEIILTTLEVLLYDPLYSWAMTPEEAANFQINNRRSVSSRNSDGGNSSIQAEVNKTAERALSRLRLKLQGMEEEGIATSIEGQVNRLIQQAKDPANLSKLFQGWQAYL